MPSAKVGRFPTTFAPADLARTAGAKVVGKRPTFAECIGGVCKFQDGADLVAQEKDCDRQKDDGGADHPKQEDMGIRRVSLSAGRDEAQDGVVVLDADLHEARFAQGIDPMLRAVASDRRRVTDCQWRSMKTNAMTPSSTTIGVMMMSRARANRPFGKASASQLVAAA